jgi:hypothetical protein
MAGHALTLELHRATFTVEDGCFTLEKVECLMAAGDDCHLGCPVLDCDWSHDEEGCQCCVEQCDCLCALDDIDDDHEGPCFCRTKAEHGEACPHAFTDIGECWLLPWVADDTWFTDDDDLRDTLRILIVDDRDDHPPETWQLTFTGIDGERDAWWAPDRPDLSTLTRVEAP